MHIGISHDWRLSPGEAIVLQRSLRRRIRTNVPFSLDRARLIAGVDVSSNRFSPLLTAGVVVWDRLTGDTVDRAFFQGNQTMPYIPGLLSFREIPVILQAIARLSSRPDVWMADGHGIAHPRRMGIATHLGLILRQPTIGVAKSRLAGVYEEPGPLPGDSTALMDGEEQIGIVLRSKVRGNPLFLSPGHLIDLSSTEDIVRASLRGYRLPEPTRLAHAYVNDMRKQTGENRRSMKQSAVDIH